MDTQCKKLSKENKKKKREYDFQSKFTRWAKENWLKIYGRTSAYVELKKSDSNTLGWSKIEAHQYTELDKAENSVAIHKISDLGAINYRPVDMVIVADRGYLAVMFNIQTQMKEFYMVNIEAIKYLKDNLKRRSLTETDCDKLGQKIKL